MSRSKQAWMTRDLGEYGYLLVGRRRGTTLSVERLNVSPGLVGDFRTMAGQTMASLEEKVARTYEPLAQLEDDEVFLLELDDLPALNPAALEENSHLSLQSATEHQGATALADLVSNPDQAPLADFDQVRRHPFLFYAVVFTDQAGAEPIAFIKKHNPAVSLKPGHIWATGSQTVRRIDSDILSFRSDFDLIIDGKQVAALTDNAIERLFVDQDIVAAAVPAAIAELKNLGGGFTLSSQAESSLLRVCAKRRLLGRRLQRLLTDPDFKNVTPEKVKKYLEILEIPPQRYIKKNELTCTDDTAAEFIDVLGAFQHRHGYTNERYRADRRSRVS